MSTSTAMQACLYIVATPIGNLSDMTPHAIDVLKQVAIIACEDTRTSGKLLSHFGIDTKGSQADDSDDADTNSKRTGHNKLWAYHEHNSAIQTPKIIEMIEQGHSVALISDAGTPLVSDPGYQLVQAAHAANVTVSPVVGASAAIAALSVAGLPSDRFSFIGFLPAKTHGRQKQLTALQSRTETLIFYEAPHRIIASLEDMATIFGTEREVTFCRELTKTFETVHKSTLGSLVEFVKADDNQQRGEIVIVIAGVDVAQDTDDISIHDKLLQRLLEDLSVKKAAALGSDITGAKKNALYQRLLTLQAK
ncbi:16S rRNA (cytidine(1402)-2'-O)-methyltransferase [Psychrobacter sp.]|uniref:16S rRNA (cytidine(1402)-2'-O)-methyltransferase n=1 Tax=Psychrobacter sp. TaxID=56811 RepID=UPI00264845EC|nr:16S rRNA (cytidine(1402)-2'-O)-methyltransferase [Psychrobacter sp.]MDN6275583.1 16S rRNA (cytidine(1402)-2'-O)-methyltransferase [Psychrobacter sp.]MDN6308130.1 16S rRNA (cytidine(1402)-2'-O)-methyltransferase [Psychrobacter sp.]